MWPAAGFCSIDRPGRSRVTSGFPGIPGRNLQAAQRIFAKAATLFETAAMVNQTAGPRTCTNALNPRSLAPPWPSAWPK